VLILPRNAPGDPEPGSTVQPLSVLRAPLPAELVKLRLETALRLARLRQHLRRPPAEEAEALAHDALTGLAGQGFLLAYAERLDATRSRRPRVVVGLAPADFECWTRAHGHPRASRALAAVGREVRRATRAEDFVAHLGEGRVIMIAEADSDGAASLRRRIAAAARQATALVLGDEFRFETAAEQLRPGEPTRRTLERTFLNLRAARALIA
jgi:GGDEF domain-containing protein